MKNEFRKFIFYFQSVFYFATLDLASYFSHTFWCFYCHHHVSNSTAKDMEEALQAITVGPLSCKPISTIKQQLNDSQHSHIQQRHQSF